MKKRLPAKRARRVKRKLFDEISEGIQALADERTGIRTLRSHNVAIRPAPSLTPAQVLSVRKALRISRAVFAAYLRTNPRTLENWEQGRARPNAQAALLISLVARFPDTVERLAAIE